ncbi:MAG: hypothetical protein JNL62_04420 [Bryobacterales bacterium]|nr:hypothetical protein [Bryobacterales bacterium]
MRRYLCEARSLKMLVSPLLRFWHQARLALQKAGYGETALEAVEKEMRGQERKGAWHLPPGFAMHIWPLVRLAGRRDQSRILSFYVGSDLELDDRLLAALTRLILLAGAGTAAEWVDVAARLPFRRRRTFLEQLLESGTFATVQADDVSADTEQLGVLATEEMFPVWCARFLMEAARENNREFLMAGFRIASQCSPQYQFEEVGQCDDFPENIVAAIGKNTKREWMAMRIWRACGVLPGLGDVIRRAASRQLTEDVKWRYIDFLLTFGDRHLARRRVENKWRCVMGELPRIEALLLATPPEYQVKVLDFLEEWLWYWDEPVSIRHSLHRAHALLPRLVRAPFGLGSGAAGVVGWLVELASDQLWPRVVDVPDTSWQAVERACNRLNSARPMARGIGSMMRELPAFALDALHNEPTSLAKTAEALGGLAFDARKQILEEAQGHPLFSAGPLVGGLREYCDRIRAHVAGPSANPIPAKLRAWLDGKCTLRDAQLERYRLEVTRRLTGARLGWIQWAVMERLKRGLPGVDATASARHALRMLGSVDENRRALRRFLRAYFSGSRDYIAMHAETSAWYRKHPRVRREIWEKGIAFPGSNVDGRFVSLSIETDPLEVLRMGTYVGTCLGLGGSFSYSAVAVLLDANKQVVYARDQRGAVIARQLVAVSKEDELVCFHIYPASTRTGVKSLFRDYDQALAQALGLPLYRRSQEESAHYEIETVVTRQWWDDLEWDFVVEDSESD